MVPGCLPRRFLVEKGLSERESSQKGTRAHRGERRGPASQDSHDGDGRAWTLADHALTSQRKEAVADVKKRKIRPERRSSSVVLAGGKQERFLCHQSLQNGMDPVDERKARRIFPADVACLLSDYHLSLSRQSCRYQKPGHLELEFAVVHLRERTTV